MRLYEFVSPDEDNARAVEIIAVSNELKQDVESRKVDPANYTTDELIDYYDQRGIILDPQNLYDMIQKPLLKGIISNIQGDKVVFKGEEPIDTTYTPYQNQSTVADMAQSAMANNPL
jgi:hypothetical protein